MISGKFSIFPFPQEQCISSMIMRHNETDFLFYHIYVSGFPGLWTDDREWDVSCMIHDPVWIHCVRKPNKCKYIFICPDYYYYFYYLPRLASIISVSHLSLVLSRLIADLAEIRPVGITQYWVRWMRITNSSKSSLENTKGSYVYHTIWFRSD